ncbi:hypothetical protein MGALJ_54040 [Mycobacterium gallinarum]|uniref:PE-PPE domain-containing protein n=1 Tax=Mycobacterium gallinarum TaxID=39689 RepID=A0A9W4BD81_9MYCO|nr:MULTISPECIES: PE-PPE domain-containing protein [Mycobacterium]MDV3135638.1 PE-PPE domain-containing protein [Mycobacterium sp. 29Ha]BBY95735.1 hypothetical protein MGALJ_54040 [Mycobacterium gallinarum]
MRKSIRLLLISLLGLLSAALFTALTALVAAVSLAATALIVPGTGTPKANEVTNYMENFRDYYMQTPCEPNGCADDQLYGIDYDASFWPIPLPGWCDPGRCEKFDVSVAGGVQGLRNTLGTISTLDPDFDGSVVIAGYSQGGRVVSIAKAKIANGEWNDVLDDIDSIKFVFIGNPNRPNGGILSRFGILGTIPILDVTTGQPTPTDTEFETEDWAIRWEGIADFPQYLLNPLAVVNSLLGFYYDHGTYLAINGDSDPGELPAGYSIAEWRELTTNPELYPQNVQIQKVPGSDTTYYTITPKVLPLVRPLHSIPLIGKPIADLFEPALRVIIEETGYNRNIPYGQATPIGLFPLFNPFTLIVKLIPAIFQGINNFLANFGLATEIPLTPPIPVPEEDEEQDENLEQLSLLSNFDDMSRAKSRLSLLQDDGGLEQQLDGDEKAVPIGLDTEEAVTPPEIVETPNADDTVGLEGAGLQQAPAGNVDGLLEEGNNSNQGDPNQGTQIVVKDPEEDQDLDDNRVDANGGSVSLNFSPNKPEGAPAGGENADPLAPVDPVKPEDVDGAEGAEPAEGAEAAAA